MWVGPLEGDSPETIRHETQKAAYWSLWCRRRDAREHEKLAMTLWGGVAALIGTLWALGWF